MNGREFKDKYKIGTTNNRKKVNKPLPLGIKKSYGYKDPNERINDPYKNPEIEKRKAERQKAFARRKIIVVPKDKDGEER